jgi:hypothetical protein
VTQEQTIMAKPTKASRSKAAKKGAKTRARNKKAGRKPKKR